MPAKFPNFLCALLFLGLTNLQSDALAQASADKSPNTPSVDTTFPSNAGVSNAPMSLQNAGSKPVVQNKLENHPSWNDLNAEQKLALAHLQKVWVKMSDFQKQKWLVISKNYLTMGPDEQSRLQSRMNDWVSLSNQERAVARLNFAEVNKLSEDQKKVKWEAYQALEPDAKQKLLDSAQPLPKGAAIAVRPTDKSLLTITPGMTTNKPAANLPRIDISQVSTKTLLVIPSTTAKKNSDKANGQSVK